MASRRRSRKAEDAEGDGSPPEGYTRQQEFTLAALRIRERGKLFALAFRCLTIVLCVYFTTGAVKALAGETTISKIAVELLSNQGFSNIVAWAFGITGTGIGLNERRLRRRDGKQLGERLKKYEELIDPGRRSSNLESQGDYREED